MAQNKKYKHYDRTHRFDAGALQSYNKGERPLSLWSKKLLLQELNLAVEHADYDLDKLYRLYQTDKEEIKKSISKLNKKFLIEHTLVRTGTHKTGNYFQNTAFYRILQASELYKFLTTYIVRPKEVVQLNLPFNV